jgi:hypothetical protein
MSCRNQSAANMKSLSVLGRTVILSVAGLAAVSGCELKRDSVLTGAYGNMAADNAVTSPRTQAGSGAPRAMAGSTAAPRAGSGAGGQPMTMTSASTGTGGAGGQANTGSAGLAGAQPMAAAGDGAPATADSGMPTAPPASAGPCDMSGRWLGTVHYVTDALGQLQYSHTYLYYEIRQTGTAFTVSKGLHCGDDAVGAGDFAATVDLSGSWAGTMTRVQHMGRAGTSEEVSGGCQIALDKWYTVRGATIPHYLDPSTTLPTAEEPASDAAPGWEDWDMDGNPGVTGAISGVVSGKIFTAPRQWTQMSGMVPDLASSVRLSLMWDQEQNVMSYDGSPLLASSAVRAADPTLHFSQFVRLQDGQAVGDDAAICATVVELAPTLTPEASGL